MESRLREIARQPLGESIEPTSAAGHATPSRSAGTASSSNSSADRAHAERGDVSDALDAGRPGSRRSAVRTNPRSGCPTASPSPTPTGRIAFANHAIAALLGQDGERESLTGACWKRGCSKWSSAAEDSDLLSPAAPASHDGVRNRADEAPSANASSASLACRSATQPHGACLVVRDVTQQKLAEQTRDRFIDTATHELRTPLANIKAYAETLATADCIDVELQKEFCNIINSEVTRLARFIDDLLSISSMEVGALTDRTAEGRDRAACSPRCCRRSSR